MSEIIITVGNEFMLGTFEYFYCSEVDMSDLTSLEELAEECCDAFLEMHHDIYSTVLADIDWDTLAEACYYMVEEVTRL